MLVIELQRRRTPTLHPVMHRGLSLACVRHVVLLGAETTAPTLHSSSGTPRRLLAAAAGGGRKMRARKITWLVTTVVVVYVACWLPYWTFQVRTEFKHVQRIRLGFRLSRQKA